MPRVHEDPPDPLTLIVDGREVTVGSGDCDFSYDEIRTLARLARRWTSFRGKSVSPLSSEMVHGIASVKRIFRGAKIVDPVAEAYPATAKAWNQKENTYQRRRGTARKASGRRYRRK